MTLALSLARSQSNLPLMNLRLVPCLPMFGHFDRLNLPIRDQWSAFRSRIRRRRTSNETPRNSCPTMISGSALCIVTSMKLV